MNSVRLMRHLAACALAVSFMSAAQAATDAPSLDRLDDIQVTATRTPQRTSDTLAATTVVTRDDIERLQVRSVRDVLRRTPGVSIANNGGPGKATSIFLRGTESDHTLVLVDGVEYRSATAGQAAIEDLPVEQIERIEIVRGPRSSLYGSDAIGGVIQIFTRDGRGVRGSRPYFQIGAGSDGTYEGQVGVAGSDDNSHYNLSVTGRRTDGFDSCRAEAGAPFPAGGGCGNDEPDDDGYDRVSMAFNYGHIFDNGIEWDLNFLRAEADVAFDGDFQNSSDNVQQVIGTSLTWRPVEPWRTKLSYGNSRDDSENFLDGRYVTAFETQRHQLTWQNDFTLPNDDLFTLGLDYEHESVDGDNDGDRRNDFTGDARADSRDNKGVFVQYLGDWGRHHVQLAGRGDGLEMAEHLLVGQRLVGVAQAVEDHLLLRRRRHGGAHHLRDHPAVVRLQNRGVRLGARRRRLHPARHLLHQHRDEGRRAVEPQDAARARLVVAAHFLPLVALRRLLLRHHALERQLLRRARTDGERATPTDRRDQMPRGTGVVGAGRRALSRKRGTDHAARR